MALLTRCRHGVMGSNSRLVAQSDLFEVLILSETQAQKMIDLFVGTPSSVGSAALRHHRAARRLCSVG
jgi:hypothetical protein